MEIKINGEVRRVEADELTIAQLLVMQQVESPEMVSVQLNGDIIDREAYEGTRVSENDEIDFLYFMGGGATSMKGFTTKALHGVVLKKDVHGSLRMPVYDSVAFEHEKAHDMQLAFEGKRPVHSYSRISNPTVADFESRIRLLSGGMAVVAVASGMAAIANVTLALGGAKSNIVTTRHLFGNTLSLFEKTLKPWGLAVRYVSMTDPAEVEQAIDDDTRAVFFESMTNPQLEVADCEAIAAVTEKHGIPLIVDNTLTTPYLFDTKRFGANIEILSSTKYISGGATSVGGVIIDNGNFDWRRSPKLATRAKQMGQMALIGTLRREVYRNLGACMSPHTAYLQSLGLETLGLRIDKSCTNALVLAKFLEKQPKVLKLNYPGLPGSPFYDISKKQFKNRFGGLLTFDLADQAACFALMDALKLIKRATNLNDNKTLVIHPSSTIFCEYPEEAKRAMNVRATMIRLAVGIEDVQDLKADLKRGLGAI